MIWEAFLILFGALALYAMYAYSVNTGWYDRQLQDDTIAGGLAFLFAVLCALSILVGIAGLIVRLVKWVF